MARHYPFSTWVYNPIDDFTPDEVDVWAEAGLNVTFSPRTDCTDEGLRKLILFLDRARDRGIKLIANLDLFTFDSFLNIGAAEYEKRLREVCAVIGDHEGLYGFYIGDEPSTTERFAATAECFRINKKVAPELKPFVNLIGGMAATPPEKLGGRSIEEWFKALKDETDADFVSLDLYGPMINDHCVTDTYKEIKTIVEAAEKADIDVWANLLLSAHLAYRCPTEQEIRWQIAVTAACGCKGVVWFRFYDRAVGYDYYGSPIDEFGNKTENYYAILRCQRRFQQHHGQLLMKLKRQSTYLTGKDRESYPMITDDAHDLVRVSGYEEGVISFFKDEDGREYLCIVNASMVYHASWNIFYDADKCSLYELSFNGESENYYAPNDPNNPYSSLSLYVGEMRIFRIDRK